MSFSIKSEKLTFKDSTDVDHPVPLKNIMHSGAEIEHDMYDNGIKASTKMAGSIYEQDHSGTQAFKEMSMMLVLVEISRLQLGCVVVKSEPGFQPEILSTPKMIVNQI